ncbi:hypothetical protein GCM10025791_00350 [Halioxenophilus aromaticivorans]|uniref:Uncharacterized protein n=1 Tax=Halioxenophilus aromaticivorans TaxID=1306992 RepID=A0AAV3TWQ7_9ALTE
MLNIRLPEQLEVQIGHFLIFLAVNLNLSENLFAQMAKKHRILAPDTDISLYSGSFE